MDIVPMVGWKITLTQPFVGSALFKYKYSCVFEYKTFLFDYYILLCLYMHESCVWINFVSIVYV